MKGGCWMKSPKRGGAVRFLFWLAGLILFVLPIATAWSFPFSIPSLFSPDEGCELSLGTDQLMVDYGNSANYSIHLNNPGLDDLTDISIADNFGQAGFFASLPAGESLDLSRTTPPLKSSTQLKVVVSSEGEEIGMAKADVRVGLPEEVSIFDYEKRAAFEDQTLKIMSASPEIELVVGADPSAVRPGEKTTVRMTVTNRFFQTLRDVEIHGPGWSVEAGDLNPGESKTYSKTITIAEDLSTSLTATGTADGGEKASGHERLTVHTISSDLSVMVIPNPTISGQPSTTEYRLKNEGKEVLSRVTLRGVDGETLGILSQLGPGESKSLTRTASGAENAPGQIKVTAISPEGKGVEGEVIVHPTSSRPATASVQKTKSNSASPKPFDGTTMPGGFGTMPEFGVMDMDLDFGEIGGFDAIGTTTDRGRKSGASTVSPEFQEMGSDAGFGVFDIGLDFGDFGFGDGFGMAPARGSSGLKAPSTGSESGAEMETETEAEAEIGSPNLVVTLQVNRTLVRKGGVVGYRCTAVNRGTANAADVALRCGEVTATAANLSPGDGLPLEGTIRADGPMNLTAKASGSGPDGSRLTDEAFITIEVISPDLNLEVSKEPEEICRGQRISIVVRLENSGDDALSNVIVSDALGEIGKISILEPGEARTLTRNSTIDKDLEDVIRVVAIDSTGGRIHRSEVLNFELLEPRLNLTVDPRNTAAYLGDAVEVVWTVKNTGEVDLADVTFDGEGVSKFRLPAVATGGTTQVSSTYFANESREIFGLAEGRTAGGETVFDSASFEIKVVSPGISLNVKPPEVEACPEQAFNLTCLVTNSGDDILKDVIISEMSLGTLEKIGRLEPGDFRVVTLDFFAEMNTSFSLEAKGTDSMGKTWTNSQNVAVKLVSANIELFVRADPPEITPGGTVNVVCTVKNGGGLPIFSTFIMSESLGHLGTIDYISPGSSRTLEREIEVSEEIEAEIKAEGFTKERASVRDQAILSVDLTVPQPPVEEVLPDSATEGTPGVAERPTAEEEPYAGVAKVESQEGAGVGEMVNRSETEISDILKDESSGIAELMNRLRDILEKIRLDKEISAETDDETSSVPTESKPTPTSDALSSASLPSTSTQLAGYRTYEERTNASPLPTVSAPSEGAGYSPSMVGSGAAPFQSYMSPETVGYSYSAEGLASSYLSSQEISPGSTEYAYSASSPTSAYLSPPRTSPGSVGYASSSSGPFSALTSPAGISPTLAGSATPSNCETADARSSSVISPKVAESKAAVEYSNIRGRSEVSPGYAEASAPSGNLGLDRPSQSKSPTKNIKLVIGDPGNLQVDRPPVIIDVGAFPPEPIAGTPVVVAVHASDDIGVKSVEMLWNTPSTTVSRMDLADITKINSQKMVLEEGDAKDGYWSYEIPGQVAGTYMAVFVKVSDGERWAEDGPYILFWSEAAPEREPEESSPQKTAAHDDRKPDAVESQKRGMLFVESTTIIGRGDISIKNEVRESSARYREELDGYGSIEMQSEKVINKGNPVVNISDSRLLVFDQGYLKGFKVMQSPAFHGGMGASVTEQFSTTTLEKSETGTISSLNRSDHTLLFNTQQAFEGIWGTKTEYSNFNKKIKAKQELSGTFETQKRISFED